MKILIAGASGYIGGVLAHYYHEQGHEVVPLYRRAPKGTDSWWSDIKGHVQGDINDTCVHDVIGDRDVDAAMYTISLNHTDSARELGHVLDVNLKGFWRMAQVLARSGCRRLLFFSTQQVYGRTGPVKVAESLPTRPLNVYGLTHLMGEEVCRQLNDTSDIHCQALRLSNSYGAPVSTSADCWWPVLNDFCLTALEKNAIRLLSDGSPQRDFIHLRDVCRATHHLLNLDPGLVPEVVNLGSGTTHTILEAAHRVASVFRERYGCEVPVELPEGSSAGAGPAPDRFQLDVSALTRSGFNAQTSLDEGIHQTFNFLDQGRLE